MVGVPHFGVGDMNSLANGLVIIGTTKKVGWTILLLIYFTYISEWKPYTRRAAELY